MAERNPKPAASADREIVITRTVDAPRERVWEAWTDPKQVVLWWGPNGFTTTIEKMDFRVGGQWKHVMHGPDGTDYPNQSTFTEIVKHERICYSHAGGKAGTPCKDFVWTFEQAGAGKTKVVLRIILETPAERAQLLEFGVQEGGTQTLARLNDHLSGKPVKPDLVLTRTLDAPRELVFKCWTDPKHLVHWWGPGGFTNPRLEADVRTGGKIIVDMRAPDGTIYPMSGTFTEVIPLEKISFLSGALDDKGNPKFEVLAVITFAESHGKTILTLQAFVTMQTPEAAPHLAGMNAGWNQSLDRMADYAACAGPDAFVISRTFDAPRDLVFKVWTQQEHLLKWFGPKGMPMKIGKLDLKPGGTFHYCLTGPDGKDMWGKWVFRDIAPPESIVLISSFSDEKGGIAVHPFAKVWPRETLSATTFTEENGKTTLTLRWVPYSSSTEAERKTFASNHASMQQGWGGTMEKLAEYLSTL